MRHVSFLITTLATIVAACYVGLVVLVIVSSPTATADGGRSTRNSIPTDHVHEGSPHMQFCQYVVAYEEEPAGSDVADPRVRCGKPATIELESGLWCCPEHAEIIHDSRDRPDKPLHS